MIPNEDFVKQRDNTVTAVDKLNSFSVLPSSLQSAIYKVIHIEAVDFLSQWRQREQQ